MPVPFCLALTQPARDLTLGKGPGGVEIGVEAYNTLFFKIMMQSLKNSFPAREYARTRIKIDGLRLVGGNPDFTNAPAHADDDARFHGRQQAYVHAGGG